VKKLVALTLALAFAAVLSVPAFACDKDKAEAQTAMAAVQPAGTEVSATGWITDKCCMAKNANKEGADCVKACAKQGAKLVFFTGEKSYVLADQKAALDHVGHEVQITGTVADDGSLKVTKIQSTEKEKV
jgi:uncharacterized protein DUF5818